MTVRDALRHGAAVLAAAGVDSAGLDARLLLSHAAGLSREELLRDPSRPIDPAGYDALLQRRAAREPLAFIVGCQEFWSLRFLVSRATLIPRPDSETLVEAALACRPDARTVLDLGTGTGCLLLATLTGLPGAFGVGTDRNKGAAALAAQNAAELGLADRAAIVCADWAAPIASRFDLVLCNPPYINTEAIAGLMPEVAEFEPRTALDGGADGLAAYRTVLPALPALLAPGGLAILELGAGQADPVATLARQLGFARPRFRADLAGISRAILLQAA